MKKLIHTTLVDFLNENNSNIIDLLTNKILDKIHKTGIQSLTYDQKKFLGMSDTEKNSDEFIKYLLDHNYENNIKEETAIYGAQPIFDEYNYDSYEDIFQDIKKTVRCINKILHLTGKYVSNSNWASGYIWKLNTDTFIYLSVDSDDLDIIKRTLIDDEDINDDILYSAKDVKGFYKLITKAKEIIN